MVFLHTMEVSPTLNLQAGIRPPLPFDLNGMGALPGAYATASIALRITVAPKPPFYDTAVALEEDEGSNIL
jgi:hypothetical protein